MKPHHAPHSTSIRGFTLLEVLVALFVLSLGLLGLAMLQTTGLRYTTNSYSRTQATYFAYDIIEKMRLNFAAFENGDYDVGNLAAANTKIAGYGSCRNSTCNCGASGASCTSGDLAAFDLGQWYAQQDLLLAGAKDASGTRRATIVRNGNSVTITLVWLEQDATESQSVAGAFMQEQAWQVEIYAP